MFPVCKERFSGTFFQNRSFGLWTISPNMEEVSSVVHIPVFQLWNSANNVVVRDVMMHRRLVETTAVGFDSVIIKDVSYCINDAQSNVLSYQPIIAHLNDDICLRS